MVFLTAAVLQWLTFEYPDINPFSASIFTPGAISQVLNWVIVVVLATIGWGFFTLWRFRLSEKDESTDVGKGGQHEV